MLYVPKVGGGAYNLQNDDIVCIRSDIQITYFYLKNNQRIISGERADDFIETLNKDFILFAETNPGKYINLEQIEEISKEDILLRCRIDHENKNDPTKKLTPSRRSMVKIKNLLKDFPRQQALNTTCGTLVVKAGKIKPQIFDLKLGVQLIGRRSDTKTADIMIETENNYMSRKHLFIDVRSGAGKGLLAAAYLEHEVNPTFVDRKKMELKDKYPLKNNSVITAGNITMTIALDDKDETTELVEKE